MSDDPAAASFLDRVNTLSAPAVVGLGAGAGLLFAVLSALRVEPSPSTPKEDLGAVAAKAAAVPDSAPSPQDETAGGGAGASGARGGAGESDAEVQERAPTRAAPSDDTPVAEDDPADLEVLEADVGAPLGDPEVTEDANDSAAAGDPPPPSPAGRTQSDRDAEAKMDADELLAAATDAYKEKRYKDAYRLATRSQRARPRDKAQMLRGRAACRLRDQKNAREIVKSFKLGDEHRKTLRAFCKDRGVRVGL